MWERKKGRRRVVWFPTFAIQFRIIRVRRLFLLAAGKFGLIFNRRTLKVKKRRYIRFHVLLHAIALYYVFVTVSYTKI